MTKLIATKALRYAGQALQPGAPFDAARAHARVLIAIGKAEKAPTAPISPELFAPQTVEPVTEPASEPPSEESAAEPVAELVDDSDDLLGNAAPAPEEAPRPRRQYRRRDLTAKSGE